MATKVESLKGIINSLAKIEKLLAEAESACWDIAFKVERGEASIEGITVDWDHVDSDQAKASSPLG